MPPAILASPLVAAAGVTAAGTVAGGLISSHGAGSAAKTQARSATEAIQFEREREARRQFEYDQAERQRREQYEGEQRRRAPFRLAAASVLSKYGIQIPLEEEEPPPPEDAEIAASGANPYSLGSIMSRGTYAR